eukprot:358855-Chlamydomonas_euryale.AAC.5
MCKRAFVCVWPPVLLGSNLAAGAKDPAAGCVLKVRRSSPLHGQTQPQPTRWQTVRQVDASSYRVPTCRAPSPSLLHPAHLHAHSTTNYPLNHQLPTHRPLVTQDTGGEFLLPPLQAEPIRNMVHSVPHACHPQHDAQRASCLPSPHSPPAFPLPTSLPPAVPSHLLQRGGNRTGRGRGEQGAHASTHL